MSTTNESLKSCLEPLLLEPRDLTYQLFPSESLLSCENEVTKEKGQHLSLALSVSKKKIGEEAPYVHPLSSKASYLSSKSLEMCTESLGCETGSGIDQFSVEEQPRRQQPIKKAKAKAKAKLNFPPPLKSISGGGGVEVQSHREGGRLVMKASSSSRSFFQAERGDGRLRLSLLKQGAKEEEEDEEEEEEEEEVGEAEVEVDCGGEEGFGVKEEVAKAWSSSSNTTRCNGESSTRKKLHTLPFCVVGV